MKPNKKLLDQFKEDENNYQNELLRAKTLKRDKDESGYNYLPISFNEAVLKRLRSALALAKDVLEKEDE